MRKSDIYEVAIKILGLYLLFTSIDLLSTVFAAFAIMAQMNQNIQVSDDFVQIPFLVLSIVNFGLVVAFALFLTLKTQVIVRFVCSPTDYEETSSLFADRKVIYEIALVLMGLILVVWTLPDFVINLREHVRLVQSDTPTNQQDMNFVITAAVKIALGLIAVIYAKSISVLLLKVSKNGDVV